MEEEGSQGVSNFSTIGARQANLLFVILDRPNALAYGGKIVLMVAELFLFQNFFCKENTQMW
ncbi:MAG: hypothetical protein H0U27_08055 [Nitrosopumilus sp.]|nr:hypothetical protein [Nitrosopumilus sp.]